MAAPRWMTNPSFTADQEDGARWDVYENPVDPRQFTILTSVGRELNSGATRSDLLKNIKRYRAVEIGSTVMFGEDPKMRLKLGKGQEATVYRMGSYAVREQGGLKSTYGALGELQRMNAISHVIDGGLPRWLHLPKQYAVHADPQTQKTYTLMDRIDSGVTIEDVLEYPNVPDFKAKAVLNEIGVDFLEDARKALPIAFDTAHSILSEAITSAGKVPNQYLTDWQLRNVIVERLRTPVAGANYNLHVIDQYRS